MAKIFDHMETDFGKSGPILTVKIGPANLILGAKLVQGTSFDNFLPNLVWPVEYKGD